MEDRFKKQLRASLKELTDNSKATDGLIDILRNKVTYYDKYNPAALACASYYSVNKNKEAMEKCINHLAEKNGVKMDPRNKEGLKLDILRYLRIFQ